MGKGDHSDKVFEDLHEGELTVEKKNKELWKSVVGHLPSNPGYKFSSERNKQVETQHHFQLTTAMNTPPQTHRHIDTYTHTSTHSLQKTNLSFCALFACTRISELHTVPALVSKITPLCLDSLLQLQETVGFVVGDHIAPDKNRLVTITGQSQMGKSVHAIMCGRYVWRRNFFPGGVLYINFKKRMRRGETFESKVLKT